MPVSFPGDSAEYRAARNRLVEQEIELRRAMEAVADARRRLPPGGVAPADYGFQPQAPDGAPTPVRLSELFTPDKNSLVIYSMMFSRALRTRCSYGWARAIARAAGGFPMKVCWRRAADSWPGVTHRLIRGPARGRSRRAPGWPGAWPDGPAAGDGT
jgi:hypothetical protein